MDYNLIVKFCDEVIPLIRAKYRFVNRRWWMVRDGYWTQATARDHLMEDLVNLSKQTMIPGLSGRHIRENVPKTHIMNQVMSRLGGLLHDHRGLPAPDPKS